MKSFKKLLIVLGAIFLGLFMVGFVKGFSEGVSNPPPVQFTSQAQANTFKNSFVSGCKGNNGLTEVTCGCAYDKLVQLYPDFATNQTRMDRIVQTGYNQAETDATTTCLQPTNTI